MIRQKHILFFLLPWFSFSLKAQISVLDTLKIEKRLSLDNVLELSKNSAEAIIAKHTFLESYWEYESIKKEILPELALTGILPQINRTITKTTLPDGKEAFVSQFYGDYSANLQLTQTIPYTNTKIFMSSGLERLDLYGQDKSIAYLSTPFSIGVSQSLFTYNASKWEQKLNPVKFNAAKQRYIGTMEEILGRAAEMYFDLLIAQEKFQNALKNKKYTDTLEQLAKARYLSQKIVESEYLQIELNALQAEFEIEMQNNVWRNAVKKLKTFLQSDDEDFWALTVPADVFLSEISSSIAIEQAFNNNVKYHEFKQREIEAQSNLMRSKTQDRFSMDIYASFGLNQNAGTLAKAYVDLMDQEMLSVGLRIPILDWGKSRGRIKIAQSQKEVTLLQINQEQLDFERELTLKVLEFNTQKRQVEIAQKSLIIAEKRLEAEKLRYGLGKGDFTQLSNAIVDKDNAVFTYLNALRSYWLLYFEIRKITLFDFDGNNKIDVDFNQLIGSKF